MPSPAQQSPETSTEYRCAIAEQLGFEADRYSSGLPTAILHALHEQVLAEPVGEQTTKEVRLALVEEVTSTPPPLDSMARYTYFRRAELVALYDRLVADA